MPKPNLPAASRFNKLVEDISQLYVKARAAQVRFAWETGRRIVQEEQNGSVRADYGARLLPELSKALTQKYGPGFSDTNLRKMRRFYLLDPKQATSPELDWSDYQELLPIKDEKRRKSLALRVIKENLNTIELRALVRGVRNIDGPAKKVKKPPEKQELLTPLRGTLYTYRIVTRPQMGAQKESGLLVDLGFGIFRNVDPKLLAGFADGDVVESRPKDDAYKFYKGGRTAKDLFTYAAYIERVVDGDTLKVRFDLGFDTWVRQTLRLRGIDCPEMDTKEGQAAKTFVQSYIKEAQLVVVRSSRSEKYGRYLADVYIPQGSDRKGVLSGV
ncbi:MAG: DUF1016 N-terminal domain-containing protein, partial [Candidatus Omnitrophota bacterium]|nr:DUF1016 N-terminal domain-containing protein [Candidatus Omnitrophota bacterium]